jgi:hypothetical protein
MPGPLIEIIGGDRYTLWKPFLDIIHVGFDVAVEILNDSVGVGMFGDKADVHTGKRNVRRYFA